MRFSLLLSFASLAITSPVQQPPDRQSILCGVAGYDKERPRAYRIDQSGRCSTPIACQNLCNKESKCKSFAVGKNQCLLYSASVASNFDRDSKSPFTFYEGACRPSQATSRTTSSSTSRRTSSSTRQASSTRTSSSTFFPTGVRSSSPVSSRTSTSFTTSRPSPSASLSSSSTGPLLSLTTTSTAQFSTSSAASTNSNSLPGLSSSSVPISTSTSSSLSLTSTSSTVSGTTTSILPSAPSFIPICGTKRSFTNSDSRRCNVSTQGKDRCQALCESELGDRCLSYAVGPNEAVCCYSSGHVVDYTVEDSSSAFTYFDLECEAASTSSTSLSVTPTPSLSVLSTSPFSPTPASSTSMTPTSSTSPSSATSSAPAFTPICNQPRVRGSAGGGDASFSLYASGTNEIENAKEACRSNCQDVWGNGCKSYYILSNDGNNTYTCFATNNLHVAETSTESSTDNGTLFFDIECPLASDQNVPQPGPDVERGQQGGGN